MQSPEERCQSHESDSGLIQLLLNWVKAWVRPAAKDKYSELQDGINSLANPTESILKIRSSNEVTLCEITNLSGLNVREYMEKMGIEGSLTAELIDTLKNSTVATTILDELTNK